MTFTGIEIMAVFGIGSLVGYFIGYFMGNKFERQLTKELIDGKTVSIVINNEGVSYRMEKNMLISKGISLEKKEDEE